MPWSHPLPDVTRVFPNFGQNLVDLAVGLAEYDKPLGVIDVGSNIGDSAVQIMARVDARVLCVEADPMNLPYLKRNLGSDERYVVEFGLLMADVSEASGLRAVRGHGTTHFARSGTGATAEPLAVSDLPARYTDLPPIRLIKSDTDGYDTTLIPALASTYSQSHPVLFFEYDPDLTRKAGKDPNLVWAELQSLGYSVVGIWDNFGSKLEFLPIDRIAARSAVLDQSVESRGYHYWDTAVIHADDGAGKAVIEGMFSD